MDAESFDADAGDNCPYCYCEHKNLSVDSQPPYFDGEVAWVEIQCDDCNMKATAPTYEFEFDKQGILEEVGLPIAVNMMNPNYGTVRCSRCHERFEKSAEGLEFTDWAKQETKHHGKTSLKDWADHEIKTHGKSMSFQDWAKHEDKSHIRRFGAESQEDLMKKAVGLIDKVSSGIPTYGADPLEDYDSFMDFIARADWWMEEYGEELSSNEKATMKKAFEIAGKVAEKFGAESIEVWEMIQQNLNNPDAVREFYRVLVGDPDDFKGKCSCSRYCWFDHQDMALVVAEAYQQNDNSQEFVDWVHKELFSAESISDEDRLKSVSVVAGCGCKVNKPLTKEERTEIHEQIEKFNHQLMLDPNDEEYERYILIDFDDEQLIEDSFFHHHKWKPLTETFRKRWGERAKLMDKISQAQVGEDSNWSSYSLERPFWFDYECDSKDTATAEDPEGYGLGFEFDLTKEEAIEKARQIHKETKGAITMYNNARKTKKYGESTRIHPKFWATPEMMEQQKEYYKREWMEWPSAEWLNEDEYERIYGKDAENWGGDPKGKLAQALAKAREKAKKVGKTLKIEKLDAEKDPLWLEKVKHQHYKDMIADLESRNDLSEMDRVRLQHYKDMVKINADEYGAETSGQWEIDQQLSQEGNYGEGRDFNAESFEAQAPRGHKMMTKELGKKIPPLYSQDAKGDEAIVYAHYFNPYGVGEWWILEWDGENEMFGYADLGFPELGYISLSELENVSIGGMELPIERDLHWREKTLGEVKQAVSKYRAESFSADSRYGVLPKCVKCNHRYADGTCGACGNILCEMCHGDGEWCKSCQAAAEWKDDECAECGTPMKYKIHTTIEFEGGEGCDACGVAVCDRCSHDCSGAESFSAEDCDHEDVELGDIIDETDDLLVAEMTCELCGAKGKHYMDSDFNDLDSEWDAESFSATKGIDTFTEPFEELSLDSGNFKKVIVGIGIGVAGILAYNKWK